MLALENTHSCPHKGRSFWSPPRISTSSQTPFSEHAQSIRVANQICYIRRKVHESRTSNGTRPEVMILGADQKDRDENGKYLTNLNQGHR